MTYVFSFQSYQDLKDKAVITGVTAPLDSRITNAEHFIIQQARVSNPDNQYNEDYVKLLKYLIKHSHFSPFELVSVNLQLKMPLDVLGQFVRHRGFHLNVLSRRYTEQELDLFLPELRFQDPKNRQNSIEASDEMDKLQLQYYQTEIDKQFQQTKQLYFSMIDSGIAKECARAILPQTTLTIANVHVNIRDLMFYLKLRLGNGTQKEHTLLAQAILDLVSPLFPNVVEAFGLHESN